MVVILSHCFGVICYKAKTNGYKYSSMMHFFLIMEKKQNTKTMKKDEYAKF